MLNTAILALPEFVATNDLTQASTDVAQDVCGNRWKIEERLRHLPGCKIRATTRSRRELKQLTGWKPANVARVVFNPIPFACALLVWTRLKAIAYNTGRTVYQIKSGMLSDYLIAQLRHPSVQMTLA